MDKTQIHFNLRKIGLFTLLSRDMEFENLCLQPTYIVSYVQSKSWKNQIVFFDQLSPKGQILGPNHMHAP